MEEPRMSLEQPKVPITDLTNHTRTTIPSYFDELLTELAPHSDEAQMDNPMIYSQVYSPDELRQRFARINHVFSDADGTILPEGLHAMPSVYVHLLHELTKVSIQTTIITGKPLAEVAPIFKAAGNDAPFDVICEKGAYIASITDSNEVKIDHLLSSVELEKEVLEARIAWEEFTFTTQTKSRPYYFGWSGSGQHRSLISIDIFTEQPPKDYLMMTGQIRDTIKLKNKELLKIAETEIEEFFKSIQPEWRIVHLGNANTDITPHLIEKDIALESSMSFQNAKGVLLLGDTNNDRAMFSLKNRSPKVTAGQVLYRQGNIPLIESSDAVTIGMANCLPYLRLLLETHSK